MQHYCYQYYYRLLTIYHEFPEISVGIKLNGKRFFGSSHWKIPGANGNSENGLLLTRLRIFFPSVRNNLILRMRLSWARAFAIRQTLKAQRKLYVTFWRRACPKNAGKYVGTQQSMPTW